YFEGNEEKSEPLTVSNGQFSFDLPAVNTGFTVEVQTISDANAPVYEGDETFTLAVATETQATPKLGQATIQDQEDNPPESKDFDTEVSHSGKTQVVFDTAKTPITDTSGDRISDLEDDAANVDLKIVISDLPDHGTLYYKDGDNYIEITADDLFHPDKSTDQYKQFDQDSIHYEPDADSEGFILGIDSDAESKRLGQDDKGSSTTDFYNWGEKVSDTVRELTLNDTDVVTITSTSTKNKDATLTQYNGEANKNHVGYGIGVGGDYGINKNETLAIEFSSRPADSITLGLDGLGGYFEQGLGKNETSVVIKVYYLVEGQTELQHTVFEFQKETSGDTELYHSLTIPSSGFDLPEDANIVQVDLSTRGDGNWELRSLETHVEDSFDYKAVDSDGNLSDVSTVTLKEQNQAPIATDDPIGFSVTLGDFRANGEWQDAGATISTSSSQVVNPQTEKQGVTGNYNSGPSDQLQYNRESGDSEQFIIELKQAVSEFSFSVSNLVKNEGGSGKHEQGKWIAYLGETVVASDTFIANQGGNKGIYHVSPSVAFDKIVFEAVDFSELDDFADEKNPNYQEGSTADSSDYFLTGFEASTPAGSYVMNQNQVLKIPLEQLLNNDSDLDGDDIRITYVFGESVGEAYIQDGHVHFAVGNNVTGDVSFQYQITDDKGGYDTATVKVHVYPEPAMDVQVQLVEPFSSQVVEGEVLAFKVVLNQNPLEATQLKIDFDETNREDVILSEVKFTNGVTYDSLLGILTVPVGVKEFSVLLPTFDDSDIETPENFGITVGVIGGESKYSSGGILDNDESGSANEKPEANNFTATSNSNVVEIDFSDWATDQEDDSDNTKVTSVRIDTLPENGKLYLVKANGELEEIIPGKEILDSDKVIYIAEKAAANSESYDFSNQQFLANTGLANNSDGVAKVNFAGLVITGGVYASDKFEADSGTIKYDHNQNQAGLFVSTRHDSGVGEETGVGEYISIASDNGNIDSITLGFASLQGQLSDNGNSPNRAKIWAQLFDNGQPVGDPFELDIEYAEHHTGSAEITNQPLVFDEVKIYLTSSQQNGNSAGFNLASAEIVSSGVVDIDDDFKYTAIDTDNQLSESQGTVTIEATSAVGSTGQHIDRVTVDGSNISWAQSAAHTWENESNASFVYDQTQGVVIDVGVGGDSVNGGSGADVIYLGESHVPNMDQNIVFPSDDFQKFVSGTIDEITYTNNDEDGAHKFDHVTSGGKADVAHGGGGNDEIYGQGGTDLIFGGSGHDILDGGTGRDALRGGSGNDTLIGGLGNDILMGGDDFDLFKFVDQGDGIRDGEVDIIKDFTRGEDALDISDILDVVEGQNVEDLLSLAIAPDENDSDDLKLTISSGDSTHTVILENATSQYKEGGSLLDSDTIIRDLLTVPDSSAI
ncbi:hypothetical protein EGH82_09600, partial [Vibrio ponticus]